MTNFAELSYSLKQSYHHHQTYAAHGERKKQRATKNESTSEGGIRGLATRGRPATGLRAAPPPEPARPTPR